jgi:ferredoxin
VVDVKWSVVVDREICMGSGLCTVYAAASFALDEEAKAVAIDPAGNDLGAIRVAIDACPTGALQLVTHDDQEG